MLARFRADIGGSIFILMIVLGGVLAWLGVV
jgi:multicomponent Na+:H+ antiporter subunit D